MKHLTVISTIIIFISYSSSELVTKSNCGTLVEDSQILAVPVNDTMCTHTLMSNFQSCCYVDFKNPITSNICVSVTNTNEKDDLQVNYRQEVHSSTAVTCPTQSKIPNSCGTIGMIEPIVLTECSGISIPESFCCMIEVKLTSGENVKVCKRLDDFPNEDSTNNTIKEELADYGTVTTITCFSSRLDGISVSMLIMSLIALNIL